MSSILADGPPEPKKFRIDMPVDASLSPPADATQPLAGLAPEEGQSPAAPSSARSSNGSIVSSGSNDKEDDVDVGMTGNLLEMISKSLLGQMAPFKLDDVTRPLGPSLSPSPKPTTPNLVPGAVAVAQSPAAQLFAEIGRLQDDWSWHRNPAASIRSGGTNKQTPVWKYFVYNKAENISRCIVGDCTYMLKGPHTSTLACHLKKHPAEYAEFQKLKVEYTRERHGGQMPSSPSSSTSTVSNGIPPPLKPVKKKENRSDVNNIVTALRNPPTSPMPNLVQNLLGMNPLQFMMPAAQPQQQPVPTSTANLTAAQATSQMLQQAGLTLTPSGQIIPSKKWRRDERRQRELESRLAVALAASHIPSDVLTSPLWKELFEVAQPKFSFPEDPSLIEQLVASHHSRLTQAIKSHIASSRKICLIIEGVKFPVSGQDEPQRSLLISASFPGYNGQKYEVQTVLIAFRNVTAAETLPESITLTIEQVLSDYDIPMDKVSKVVCLGLKGVGLDFGELYDKQIDSFCDRLLTAFNFYLDNSQTIKELKEAVFAMIVCIVAKPEALVALNKAAGGHADLPLTEHFVTLCEAVLKFKDVMQMILCQGPNLTNFSESQWTLLRALVHAAQLIKQAASGDITTIDGALPALRQLLTSLEKDNILAPVAEELKGTIEDHLESILNVNSANFDGTYVLSTALNPQLAVLLNDEQIAYAKKTLEKQLRSRIPANNRPNNVDTLLANVMNQTKMCGSDLSTNPVFADIFQQAHERIQQDKSPSREQMAQHVVTTYFDEILNGCAVDALLGVPFGNRAFGHPFQPPLLFWQQANGNCPQFADLAQELLCIPQAPPQAGKLLSQRNRDAPWHQPDVSLLLSQMDKPDRLERNLLLRANRSFLPKTY